MRVIVTGGRTYTNHLAVHLALAQIAAGAGDEPVTLVHGGATGADTLAVQAAIARGWQVEEHPADWERHKRAAGPIRNRAMVGAGGDLVLAFPGGRGTRDCVRAATAAGIPVRHITPEATP